MGVTGDEVIMSLGTSGTVSVRTVSPVVDATGAVQSVADAAGSYRPLVCTQNATRVTDAFAAVLDVDLDTLAGLALLAPGETGRPILLPYLEGERTPDRPTATGTLTGLRTDTTREALARASFEGVLCGLFSGLDRLAEVGAPDGGRLEPDRRRGQVGGLPPAGRRYGGTTCVRGRWGGDLGQWRGRAGSRDLPRRTHR